MKKVLSLVAMLLLTVMASAKVVTFEPGITSGSATVASETDEMYLDGIFVTTIAEDMPVMENIAALKAYDESDAENVLLNLADAKVTYVGTAYGYDDNWDYVEQDVVVFEDASAGMMLKNSGLGKLVEEGQVLNGKLAISVEPVWGDVSVTLLNGLNGVEATDGEITPLVITDDNIFDYLESPDWRLVDLSDVKFIVESGDYGDDLMLENNQIGQVALMDAIGAFDFESIANVESAESFTGYYYTMWGGAITAFQPVQRTVNTIAGFKSVKSSFGPVKLNRKNSQVNVVNEDYGIFIQDATGGLLLSGVELNVEAGQKLSGYVLGTFGTFNGFEALVPAEDEDGSNLTVADGTLEVKEVTIAEAAEDVNELRLVKVSGTYFAEEYAMYDIIEHPAIVDETDEPLFISDIFEVLDEDQEIEDDTDVTVTGIVRLDRTLESLYGTALTIIPVSVGDNNAVTTDLKSVKKVMENGQMYNLNGVRVAAPQKGIYIQNGRKVIVK